MIYKTEFYHEICCDLCNEVIHCHFDCPVCNSKYGEEGMSWESGPYYDEDFKGMTFSCEKCETFFKVIKYMYGKNYENIIQLIEDYK